MFFLLLTVVNRNNETSIKQSASLDEPKIGSDIKVLKEFILKKIKSPFTNINYEINYGYHKTT